MRPLRFIFTLASLLVAATADGAPALEWQSAEGYRCAEVTPAGAGRVGFTRVSAAQSGVAFTNRLADLDNARNRILENGSGVAAGDFDGDGWCDLYFCRLGGPNALFRNLGDWQFEEVAQAAGVACPGQFSTGAAFADLDGDGRLDLLVGAVGGGVRCFLNVGGGKFVERLDSGLSRTNGTMTFALADVDLDGDLDLYVANYRAQTVKDAPVDPGRFQLVNGRWQIPPELTDRFVSALDATGHPILHEQGEADVLYLNDGTGHFTPVSWTDGHFLDEDGRPLAHAPLDWSLSAAFRDLNGDGLPDLYVCSDFVQPDRCWINQGHGRFRAMARGALTRTSRLSMGVDFGDLNREGRDDFLVVDMLSPERVSRLRQREGFQPATWSDYAARQRPQVGRNTLFRNRGDGTFAEIAQLAGLAATDWSWQPVFLDVDLDGFEDILVGNGAAHDYQDSDAQRALEARPANSSRLALPPLHPTNYLFRNLGNYAFEEVGKKWGFASTNISQGMILADLDNDGDLDVVINPLNAGAELYRNDAPGPRIEIRLRGRAANTSGLGARVRVRQGRLVQEQEITAGGRYLSSDEAVRVFAADPARGPLALEVDWPGGRRSRIADARPNRSYEIFEPAGAPPPPVPRAEIAPLFADVSALLPHRHRESVFDDGELQPLLARQFSTLGPPLLVTDLDGDGWEDLVLGNGAGHAPDCFRNAGGERFTRLDVELPASLFPGDQTAWVACDAGDGALELLCGLSNYENPRASTNAVLRFRFADRRLTALAPLPGWGDSVGPLCLADIDHDGQPDLFVGGRLKPGRYPEPASSKLFRRRNGAWVEDATSSATFANLGLVSAAAFSDLDGDGWPDLIAACEWGPVRIFLNQRGTFVEATDRLGLARFTGWWNALAVADVDHDGRPDLIAGNWGRNTKYQPYLAHPVSIHFGELESARPFFQTETYFEPSLGREVPWWDRDSLATLLPQLAEKFPTHAAYARAGLEEILGEYFPRMKRLEAATLESLVFLNRGDHFEAVPLPLEAQLAPCFGIAVADFDGDGNPDLFLSQNFSGTELETSPYNDGVGALLLGDGRGGFTSLRPAESGLWLPGDGRGCRAVDWKHDGRPGLIATQNNQATRLFQNRRRTAVRRAGAP